MPRTQRIATLVELYAVLVTCVAIIGFVGYRAFHPGTIAAEQAGDPVPAYGTVPVVMFYLPTCPACKKVTPAVESLAQQYPKQVVRVNGATARGRALVREYYAAYRVPKEKQNRIPIAFAGDRFFLGTIAVGMDLPEYMKKAMSKGGLHAPPASKAAVASAT